MLGVVDCIGAVVVLVALSFGNQETVGIEVIEEIPQISQLILSLLFVNVCVEIMFLFQMINVPNALLII